MTTGDLSDVKVKVDALIKKRAPTLVEKTLFKKNIEAFKRFAKYDDVVALTHLLENDDTLPVDVLLSQEVQLLV